MFFFWQALKTNRADFMGIGQFRREVQRWLNGSLFSAQQDAESESRMPTVVDPVGIIGQRVVDDVEESLSESRPGSRANAPAQATGQLRRALAEINVKTVSRAKARQPKKPEEQKLAEETWKKMEADIQKPHQRWTAAKQVCQETCPRKDQEDFGSHDLQLFLPFHSWHFGL